MYFTYILQSEKDNTYYIGYTSNLDQRVLNHNLGLSKYTSSKVPWKLVYYEVFESKSDAIKRENQVKKYKGNKRMIMQLVESQRGSRS